MYILSAANFLILIVLIGSPSEYIINIMESILKNHHINSNIYFKTILQAIKKINIDGIILFLFYYKVHKNWNNKFDENQDVIKINNIALHNTTMFFLAFYASEAAFSILVSGLERNGVQYIIINIAQIFIFGSMMIIFSLRNAQDDLSYIKDKLPKERSAKLKKYSIQLLQHIMHIKVLTKSEKRRSTLEILCWILAWTFLIISCVCIYFIASLLFSFNDMIYYIVRENITLMFLLAVVSFLIYSAIYGMKDIKEAMDKNENHISQNDGIEINPKKLTPFFILVIMSLIMYMSHSLGQETAMKKIMLQENIFNENSSYYLNPDKINKEMFSIGTNSNSIFLVEKRKIVEIDQGSESETIQCIQGDAIFLINKEEKSSLVYICKNSEALKLSTVPSSTEDEEQIYECHEEMYLNEDKTQVKAEKTKHSAILTCPKGYKIKRSRYRYADYNKIYYECSKKSVISNCQKRTIDWSY